MPALSFHQYFGSQSRTFIDPPVNEAQVIIDLRSFLNQADGGDILNNLGISDLYAEGIYYQDNADWEGGNAKFSNLVYAILILIKQNQAAKKDDDPEQDIYIAESGISVVNLGNRKGQLERRFTISFFSDETYPNSTGIDSI